MRKGNSMKIKNKRLISMLILLTTLTCVGCGNSLEDGEVDAETVISPYIEAVDSSEENTVIESEGYPIEDNNVEITVTNEQGNTPTNLLDDCETHL